MATDSARVLSAASFAAERHLHQRRKDADASPYINHPLAVASILADEGGVADVELLMAALLHDTVEDTTTSPEEICEAFGKIVQELVREVTDDKSLPKHQRKQLQVELAPKKSRRAKQLKIADKICNIRDINHSSPVNWDRDRKLQYLEWSTRVVDGCRGINSALESIFDAEVVAARKRLQ